jgi:hypothetical protein
MGYRYRTGLLRRRSVPAFGVVVGRVDLVLAVVHGACRPLSQRRRLMSLRDDCIENASPHHLAMTQEEWDRIEPLAKDFFRAEMAPLVDAVLETVAERCEERLAESDKWLGVLPKNEIIRLQREAIEATLKSLASECREGTE